jgi:sulfur carrier protein ThiS
MPQATFRFYEELNDFLPLKKRKRDFSVSFPQQTTVEDVIASLGVPDAEISLILVNGESVDLSHPLLGGERISVYPVFESFDIRSSTNLRPGTLRDLRFVVDGHLGELAKYLRLLGFDTLYKRDADSQSLVDASVQQGRVLLTRNRTILKHQSLTRGILIQGSDPKEQLKAVFERLDLYADPRLGQLAEDVLSR